jgi:spore maturation protein CgeB
LQEYFDCQNEIVVVNSIGEMAEKIRYYLDHEDERKRIAEAGWQRMQKDHQWHHRLKAIFEEVGIWT